MKYWSQWSTFILKSNFRSYWCIIRNNNVHTSNGLPDIRQNHWTMKYRSQWPTFIFRSNFGSYIRIIPNNNVHTSKSPQDIRQNHWIVSYRSQWSIFILRSNIRSYWTIIPNCHVHTSNSLQDIGQNHWTVKYRSQWSTFILRSNVRWYWTIIPNCHVHSSNNLQDIRRHHFPHYKSMGAFCCHGHQNFDPICLKTLCSLSPPTVMLQIKFDQDWPTGFRDIQVRKCKIFVIQGQVTPKWAVWFGPKSNSSELLCLSWLPATLMMIR